MNNPPAADDRFEAAEVSQYPPDLGVEPVHLDIQLAVDMDKAQITGTVKTTLIARRSGADSVNFDAVGLEIVKAGDPDGHPFEWSYDGERLRVSWLQQLEQTEQRVVSIDYQVAEPIAGVYFSRPQHSFADEHLYMVTDHETEMARYWLPCIDSPSVRPRIDFHITAEERFTILANGQQVGEQRHNNGTKTSHWRLSHGCPSYLICIAIGEFVESSQEPFGDIPISFFSTPRHTVADLDRSFGMTSKILPWMQDKLGMSYPYPKYYQIALPILDGAMENISLVTWTDQAVLNEELARERGRLVDSVNVHEMAHSYFGNLVVCRDFAHAWLKESWATYMEQCWLEDAHGEAEASYQYFRNLNAYFKEADSRYRRPIVLRSFRSSRDMYDQHLYAGGACRLHMLRHIVGDEVFWPAVRAYLSQYAGKIVETADFRRVLETESGHSLVEFFEQWFYRPGYPVIEVGFEYDPGRQEGRFVIEQKARNSDAEGSSVFRFRTRLGWTLEGNHYTKLIEVCEAYTEIAVPLESEPEMARFDADNTLVHKLDFDPGATCLLRQLEAAPDVIGRIRAAQTLMAKGNTKHVGAVVDALLKERFWGVRVEIAGLLGKAHTDTALNGLIDAIYHESDPRVLEAIVDACGGYIDQRIRDTLVDRLEHGLPYRARAAAYRALGAQRELAPWELLLGACGESDHSGLIQGGAFIGLALTRRREAVPVLLEKLQSRELSASVYPYLIRAIGEIGSVSERADRERAIKALEPLLRIGNIKIRRAAADALFAMRARESKDKLEAYRALLPYQEQVKLDRRIKQMDSAQDDASSLRREIEDLQLKFRSLERRLQRLDRDHS